MMKVIFANLLVVCFFNVNPALAQQKGLITTFEMVDAVEAEKMKNDVKSLVSKTEVEQKLVAMGISFADVNSRIEGLTAYEISQLNSEIQQAKAGGVLLTILLVLAIIYFAQRV